MTTFREFLNAAAAHGPATALLTDSGLVRPGPDTLVRRLDAGRLRTEKQLFDGYARAWDFPKHFGGNRDAFDDAIRDLPGSLRTATGGHPASLLTVITRGEQLLADARPITFDWFASGPEFYRDHYHDETSPPLGFALAVVVSAADLDDQSTRWRRAAAPVTVVDERE